MKNYEFLAEEHVVTEFLNENEVCFNHPENHGYIYMIGLNIGKLI